MPLLFLNQGSLWWAYALLMVGLCLAYGRFVPESSQPTKKQGAVGKAERILRTATG